MLTRKQRPHAHKGAAGIRLPVVIAFSLNIKFPLHSFKVTCARMHPHALHLDALSYDSPSQAPLIEPSHIDISKRPGHPICVKLEEM